MSEQQWSSLREAISQSVSDRETYAGCSNCKAVFIDDVPCSNAVYCPVCTENLLPFCGFAMVRGLSKMEAITMSKLRIDVPEIHNT